MRGIVAASFCAAGLLAAPASAQPMASPPTQKAPPPVDVGALTRAPVSSSGLHLDLLNSVAAGDGPFASSRAASGVGPLWFVKTGATFTAPGALTTTVSIVGRQGYDVPLYMTETVGTSGPTGFGLPSGHRTQYDLELRLRKNVLTRGKLHVDVVGDAILPLRVSSPLKDKTEDPVADQLTNSKTLRVGVSISR